MAGNPRLGERRPLTDLGQQLLEGLGGQAELAKKCGHPLIGEVGAEGQLADDTVVRGLNVPEEDRATKATRDCPVPGGAGQVGTDVDPLAPKGAGGLRGEVHQVRDEALP